MRKILLSTMMSVFLGLGSASYAQNPDQETPSKQKRDRGGAQERDRSEAQEVSITGCLMKGSTSGEYTITDQKSGEKVSFTGSAKLDKYVNQTVKITGKMSGAGADKVFQPETLDPVSPSCESGR